MSLTTPVIRCISRCLIKPQNMCHESLQPWYLTPWDLQFLTWNYIQTGLLFTKPQHVTTQTILDHLKHSLSTTLTHFFPLSGRLVTKTTANPPSYFIFLDCKDGPGAEFIHALADLSISDILSPTYVPSVVDYFFPLGIPINHDGHSLPILAVQVTELVDGIFIGCSFNHAVGDGSSFWHFMNSWSEVCRSRGGEEDYNISRLPITKRWFLDHHSPIINLPYTHSDEFIRRHPPDPCKRRVFHFTPQSIAQLKAKANADIDTVNQISSLQALAALVWRSVTRARRLSADQMTKCLIPVDDRSKLEPPLSKDYFGNCMLSTEGVTTTVGELLRNNLGWAAWMLHNKIAEHTIVKVRSELEAYHKNPHLVVSKDPIQFPDGVRFGMSPRFDVYTNDFGWGEPVTVLDGHALKFDGMITWYPGPKGRGRVDLEICLCSKAMKALEADDEFRNAVSPSPHLKEMTSSRM